MSTPPKKRAAPEAPAPVVVVRKVVHKGGHHGGAWKVAYADFVTTMMALFIVLWASGQDTNVRESIANYFRNPNTPVHLPLGGRGTGVLPAGTGVVGSAEARPSAAAGGGEDDEAFEKAGDSIRIAVESVGELRKLSGQIRIDVNPEGLRVQFVEFDDSLFFEVGSARLKPALTRLLGIVGGTVGKLPNGVIVEGHTDRRGYGRDDGQGYSNWELSADRANSARRVLEASGIDRGHIVRVIGYADREPLVPDNPLDPTNRRVSVIVKRRQGAGTPIAGPGPAAPASGTGAAERLRHLLGPAAAGMHPTGDAA
jgi:chemotaxis protein MotB